jgi:hypothetical protein
LYPGIHRLREVSIEIARAVMRHAPANVSESEIEARLQAGMWSPQYRDYALAAD